MRETEERFLLCLLTSGKSEQTAQTYAANIRVFREWCTRRELDPDTPCREVVERYVADERSRLHPNTLALRLSCIRAFYAFLGAPDDMLRGIVAKRMKLAPRRPFSQEELCAVLAACRNKRDRDMIIIAARTAMRIAELVNLRAWDVDLRNGVILVHGKGQRERWLAMDDVVMMLIEPYLQHPSGILWWTREGKPLSLKRAKRNMGEIAKRAKVKAHWHRLRRTYATWFLREMHDLDALQTILGHADASTTRRYADAEEQERALAQMRAFGQAELGIAGKLLGDDEPPRKLYRIG